MMSNLGDPGSKRSRPPVVGTDALVMGSGKGRWLASMVEALRHRRHHAPQVSDPAH